jgi:hypothetical protein
MKTNHCFLNHSFWILTNLSISKIFFDYQVQHCTLIFYFILLFNWFYNDMTINKQQFNKENMQRLFLNKKRSRAPNLSLCTYCCSLLLSCPCRLPRTTTDTIIINNLASITISIHFLGRSLKSYKHTYFPCS